jgi:hypothetical protein
MDCHHALDFIPEKDEATRSLKENPRSTLYHCTQHLLNALQKEANPKEKQALFRSLEWLGIAEIKGCADETETKGKASADEVNNQER